MTATTFAGVAVPRAANARPAARDTSALTGAWFEAPAPGGSLRLYASGAARHAADAAVTLGRCEALLDALDVWIGTVLPWRWIPARHAVTSTLSHVRVSWRADEGGEGGSNPPACRIELPRTLLRALPAPDETLARQLCWAEVPVVLAIAQMRIGDDELALLEPGGAVVLPESMQRDWIGTLRAVDEPPFAGAPVPVRLLSPWSPRRIRAGAHAAAAPAPGAGESAPFEVRLAVTGAMPGDRLAGWFEGDLGEVGPRAGLWRCATGRAPASCLATGELMPLGDGWALALQEVYEIRQAHR
jgi:hypothetical protein